MREITKKCEPSCRYTVVMAASFYFFYTILQLSLFNIASQFLMSSLKIKGPLFGFLAASYPYMLAITILPVGYLLDRYGTRKIAMLSSLLMVSATLLLAFQQSDTVVIYYRLVTGFCNGCAFLIGLRVVSYWFQQQKALASGLLIAFGMSGGFFATLLFPYMVAHWGWALALWLNAIMCCLVVMVIFCFIKVHNTECQQSVAGVNFKEIAVVFKNKNNIVCGLYTGLLNLSVYVLAGLWSNLYLQQVYHFSLAKASSISGIIFIGIIIGSPCWGYFSDRIHRQRLPMIIGAMLSIAVIISIIHLPSLTSAELYGLFLLLGLTTSAQVISYPTIAENNDKKHLSTATGFSAILINVIGASGQILFGMLLAKHWTGQVIHHTPFYSMIDWHFAMGFLCLAFILALISSFAVKDTSS